MARAAEAGRSARAAAFTLSVIAAFGACAPSSDAKLIARFKKNQATLETLVRMVEADRLVATSWGGQPASRSPAISEARSLEYSSLLQKAGRISVSVRRGSTDDRIQFHLPMAFSLACGYAYSRLELAPQLASLDQDRDKWERNVSHYRSLATNWYLECAIIDD